MKLKLKSTTIFQKNEVSKARVTLNVGSSRSSKTFSLMQLFTIKLWTEENIVITIVRKTLPSLKATAYRDFLDILHSNNLYNKDCHNKSDLTYTVGSNSIEFISIDSFEKVKGRKRDYLFVNEANELTYQEFTQLALRTTKQIFLDLNPSHEDDHWIETKIKTRPDLLTIHSTYLDNPFLDENTIFEIERLKDTDPNLWRIYGLGERGIAEARIYTHFGLIDALPVNFDVKIYWLDFGFNNPTSFGEIRVKDDEYFAHELIYQKGLTNSDLIEKLKELEIGGSNVIYADCAEPQRIEELRRAGFNVMPANKDVKKGIDTVKSKKVSITKESVNTLKESRAYSWKVTADGKILDEPVKVSDHSMDGIRYAIHTYQQKTFIGFV